MPAATAATMLDGLGRACISSDLPRVAAAVAVAGLIAATVLAALDLRALASKA